MSDLVKKIEKQFEELQDDINNVEEIEKKNRILEVYLSYIEQASVVVFSNMANDKSNFQEFDLHFKINVDALAENIKNHYSRVGFNNYFKLYLDEKSKVFLEDRKHNEGAF